MLPKFVESWGMVLTLFFSSGTNPEVDDYRQKASNKLKQTKAGYKVKVTSLVNFVASSLSLGAGYECGPILKRVSGIRNHLTAFPR